MSERLKALADAGVSIWLDDLSRERIETGNLADLVKNSFVVGVTTNPTIFASALSDGERYDDQVRELAAQGKDAEATIASAKQLWKEVDRENLFIKIPATTEGGPAITDVLGEGISVNVTLIFGLDRYDAVMDAYLEGLEKAKANGKDLSKIHSVASFFVSRVDTEIDKRLDASGDPQAGNLKGLAAIANARLAYQAYEKKFAGERFAALKADGANTQRPLWASTGVKNPDYRDTMYVSDLVVANIVNTMPEKTMLAFADHGEVLGDMVTTKYDEARQVMADLAKVGVDYDDVIATLEREGVDKFAASWDQLAETVKGQLEGAKQ
jgi:transaldolase